MEQDTQNLTWFKITSMEIKLKTGRHSLAPNEVLYSLDHWPMIDEEKRTDLP